MELDEGVEDANDKDENSMEIDKNDDELDSGDEPKWMAEAYITNANYHVKKMVFLLFINRAP